jgi:thioredoxin-related protein
MNRLFPAVFIIAVLPFVAFTAFTELPIGAALPKANVLLKDVSGRDVTLQKAAQKNGLLVMFTANTCPYVIKNQQRTNDIGRYALENKIGVVLINSNEAGRNNEDSYSAMQVYAKAQNYQWHYLLDENSQMADAFGANRTPETFLFNGAGKLVYHGAIDDNPTDQSAVKRKHLEVAISEMIAGKDIAVKTSRSVGCAIKRL